MTDKRKSTESNGGVLAVAKAVGVSKSTVSRAFNSPEAVKAEVREKIFEAAAKMNYRPHPAARALRSQRSHIVGAAIPTLDHAIFARMINEFQNKFTALGASTIVITTGFDGTNIYENVRQLVDRGAEALLLVGQIVDARLIEYLEYTRIPVVTTYVSPSQSTVPAVGFDNYRATAEIVKYLIDQGHRNFVMIASDTQGNDRQLTRIAAYNDVLREAGLEGAERIYNHPYEMRLGAEVVKDILADFPKTTAIVCNSDVFAIGAMSGCRDAGLNVPRDISIVGYDDFDFAELLVPPLTTIKVPATEMGAAAADALWNAITDREPVAGKLMQTELVIRGSSGPAPKNPNHKE